MKKLRTLVRTKALPLMGAAVLGLAVTGCGEDSAGPEVGADIEDIQQEGEETGLGEEEGLGEEGELGDEEVFADSDQFVGEEVTVSGQVTSIINENAFRLSGDDFGGEGLLVFSATGLTEVDEGTVVQVTGTVRQVQTDTFEDDFGFGFDQEAFGQFEGENAIAADSVEVLQTETEEG